MAKDTRSRATCFVHPRIVPLAGPVRSAILVRDGRVAGFQRQPDVEVVELPGAAVLPAFADAHLHLLPLIEREVGVDCRSSATLDDLLALIAGADGDGWVRATGYDLGSLHPTRVDLDAAQPDRPIRVLHRTGHLAVMNSAGLRAIPPEIWSLGMANGYVELGSDGEPTGRLWEPSAWLSGAVLPPLSDDEISRGLRAVTGRLFSLGITAVHDASPTNDAARLALWQRATPPFRLQFLPGERFDAGLPSSTQIGSGGAEAPCYDGMDRTPVASHFRGAAGGSESGRLVLGPTKLMLPDTPEALPPASTLRDRIVAAGRHVAIHAVIHQAVRLALDAIALAGVRGARIEHAAEWPLDVFERARRMGVSVVVHPGWVRERAARYLATVDPEILPWLHRGRSFVEAGIPLLFGSDAPASEPDPIGALATAVTRRAADGTLLTPSEGLSVLPALRALVGGRAALDPASLDGALRVGARADFIVLDRDPFATPAGELASIRVLETYRDGERVWPASG